MKRGLRTVIPAITLLLVAAAAPPVSATTQTVAPAAASTISARNLLERLVVRAEKGSSTYDRAKFKHWTDGNGDCQDTRAEVLISESTKKVSFTSSSRCTVSGGKWFSKYDDRTWTRASDVDIDHMIPLKEAWISGARNWTKKDRRRFANDRGLGASLLAMTDNLNASKGARDPADWLPPNRRCSYTKNWIKVKYRWRLKVNKAEHRALAERMARSCGSDKVRIPQRAR